MEIFSSKSLFLKGNMVNIYVLYRTNLLVNFSNSNNYRNNSNPSDLEFPGWQPSSYECNVRFLPNVSLT